MRSILPLSLGDRIWTAATILVAVVFLLWIVSPSVIKVTAPLNHYPLPAPFDSLALGSSIFGLFLGSVLFSLPSIYRTRCDELMKSRALVICHD